MEKILMFNGLMNQAILEGRKTQTRRIFSPQYQADEISKFALCPYGHPGDIVWVENTDNPTQHTSERIQLEILSVKTERLRDISESDAISEGVFKYGPFGEYAGSLHPNGGTMKYRAYEKPIRAFQDIWESIYDEQSWKDNPLVWVIEFKKL